MHGFSLGEMPPGHGAAFATKALKYDESGRPWLDPLSMPILTGEAVLLGTRFLVVTRDISEGSYRVRVSFVELAVEPCDTHNRPPLLPQGKEWLEVTEVLEPYQRPQ